MWQKFLWVGIGGFLGAIARYSLGGWVQQLTSSSFPYGTLAVNVTGSLLLGILGTLSIQRGIIPLDIRLFAMTGFFGSLTTFSTFSHESFQLLRNGSTKYFLLNITSNVLVCLLGVWIGALIAEAF